MKRYHISLADKGELSLLDSVRAPSPACALKAYGGTALITDTNAETDTAIAMLDGYRTFYIATPDPTLGNRP
jgi:hypothetical protein